MDKLNVLVTRVTGLMGQNGFVTDRLTGSDRQTDRRADSYSGFFAKLVLFCPLVMFFFFFCIFCICNALFLFISPEQNAQMNCCHY